MSEGKITLMSSGGTSEESRPVITMQDAKDFSEAGLERMFNLEKIIKAKIDENPLFIFAQTNTITTYVIGQLAACFEVVPLTPDKWADFRLSQLNQDLVGRKIIWINFWGDGFIESQIANGNIIPEHYIMALCKTEEKKAEYRLAGKYVEFWFNSEMDGGIKFPECNTYHYLSKGFVPDPYFDFNYNENNCVCGYQGKTMEITQKSE